VKFVSDEGRPMRHFLTAAVFLAAATAAQAASLTVPIDQTRRLPISGSAQNVVIGNTDIADVKVVDSRTLMVIGKKPGVTNIVVMDAGGRTLFNDQVMVSAGAGSVVTVYSGAETVDVACSPYCKSVDTVAAAD
jgi:Flp pilus assembly secretin CpaC